MDFSSILRPSNLILVDKSTNLLHVFRPFWTSAWQPYVSMPGKRYCVFSFVLTLLMVITTNNTTLALWLWCLLWLLEQFCTGRSAPGRHMHVYTVKMYQRLHTWTTHFIRTQIPCVSKVYSCYFCTKQRTDQGSDYKIERPFKNIKLDFKSDTILSENEVSGEEESWRGQGGAWSKCMYLGCQKLLLAHSRKSANCPSCSSRFCSMVRTTVIVKKLEILSAYMCFDQPNLCLDCYA